MSEGRRIALIQGHPDASGARLLRALGVAYAEAAKAAGHEVRVLDVAALDFTLLRGREEWRSAAPEGIRKAQEDVAWAQHLVILFPLWLGEMPALLKGFFEQLLRPGFATSEVQGGTTWKRLLGGRSVRIVVTMGMPAFIYRWYFRAHGLKNLKRNILSFCGLGPIRETLIGNVEGCTAEARQRWLVRLRELGARGA